MNSVSPQCARVKSSISRKPEDHPKILSGKKLFKYGVMLNFLCFFVLFNAVKTDTKLTLHHIGKKIIIQLIKIKFKIWRVTFLKSFFTIKNNWDGLPVFTQETIYYVFTEMRQSLTGVVVTVVMKHFLNTLSGPALLHCLVCDMILGMAKKNET